MSYSYAIPESMCRLQLKHIGLIIRGGFAAKYYPYLQYCGLLVPFCAYAAYQYVT